MKAVFRVGDRVDLIPRVGCSRYPDDNGQTIIRIDEMRGYYDPEKIIRRYVLSPLNLAVSEEDLRRSA